MNEHTMYFYDVDNHRIQFEKINIEEPRQCMHCKNTGKQNEVKSIGTFGKGDPYSLISLFACSFCGSTTIHYLQAIEHTDQETYKKYFTFQSFESIPSIEYLTSDMSEVIREKFPLFLEIYIQSEDAQNSKMNHLAGMGFRKALEFLVTDYLIQFPIDGVTEEWLTNPKVTLGSKISKIENPRIQNLSKAISYLGNDETHYSRQHPEYDIDSIKAFIHVLISDVENEIVMLEAEKLINKPKL